ncbi:subtilisin inhibitor-like [Carica papaya]|uniref:subtilisin inhibitor-like n=1 Tax=Carica papaya TaxID=3649 RepID=UPI000B8C7620|nr:subtilisin inhibitor-like [Carica papaya]
MEEEKQQPHQQPTPTLPLPRFYGQLGGSNDGAGKSEWPELVGKSAEEAERKIKEEMPGAKIHVVPSDHYITMDFRLERVRLFVDSAGIVEKVPRTG